MSEKVLPYVKFGVQLSIPREGIASEEVSGFKPVWEWKGVTGALSGKGYAVRSISLPRPKVGYRYQWISVRESRDVQYLVCRANNWSSYHLLREGKADPAGQHYARFTRFDQQYSHQNNLIFVLYPENGEVVTVEFGIRKPGRNLMTTVQQIVYPTADPAQNDRLIPSYGLRKLLLNTWPNCGVDYKMSQERASEISGHVLKILLHKVNIKVIWHSLRLGLIKGRIRGSERQIFFDDHLFHEQPESLKLLRKGRSLVYHPPWVELAQGTSMFRRIGDDLAVCQGHLVKPRGEPRA